MFDERFNISINCSPQIIKSPEAENFNKQMGHSQGRNYTIGVIEEKVIKLEKVLKDLEGIDQDTLDGKSFASLGRLKQVVQDQMLINEEGSTQEKILTTIEKLQAVIKERYVPPEVVCNFLGFVQDPDISSVSRGFQEANQQTFDLLAQEYDQSSLLKVYASDKYQPSLVSHRVEDQGKEFVKQVYTNLKKELEIYPDHTAILSQTKESHGSVLATKRLEELAQWINDKEAQNFVLFAQRIASNVSDQIPEFQTFLNQLTGNDEEKAVHIKQWMENNQENLSKMTKLVLEGTATEKLIKLPAEIRFFKNIKTLNLTDNCLKRLPIEIGKCTALNYLKVNKNALEELPAEVGHCIHLQVLQGEHNQLKSVPGEIGQCRSLLILRLNHNELDSIPEEIGHCQSLINLSLDHNKLKALPPSIGKLTALQELLIQNNRISTFPVEIKNCKSLLDINLNDNPLLSGYEGLLQSIRGLTRRYWQEF